MTDGFIIKDGVLIAYILLDAIVMVPEGVSIIGKGAFKGLVGIEQVIFPESVTSIMEDAFKGCRKLKEINFPSSLIHIGDYAFHRCHALHHVKLPKSVKSLNNCTFLYCDSLEYVSIPGVTQLGKQVFLNDNNIKTLEISIDLDISCIRDVFTSCGKISKIRLSDGTTFTMENVIDVISAHTNVHPLVKAIATDIYRMMEFKDGVVLKFLTNIKHVEIPNGITGIGKSCFFDKKGIISVKLPETLTDIESKAFRNCINLERIEFTNETVNISKDAFKNCTTLKYIKLSGKMEYELTGLADTSIDIPQVVRTIHSQLLSNFFIIGTTLIQYRGNEERVVVPDGITIISERAFAGNEAIGRVVLPDSVREIQKEAFLDCLLLQTIHLSESVEYIGESAFENCVKLIRVKLPEVLRIIDKSVFNRCKKLNEVQFGSNLRVIANQAFYACISLKNIHLPEGLSSIGDMAFYKCTSLREITLPKSLGRLSNNVFTASGVKSALIKSNLNEWGTDIFSQCKKLRKLTFEEGVTAIGEKFAFQCPALSIVHLPSTIQYIGRGAFEGSIFLKMVQTVCNDSIFINGGELSGDIVIPEGVIYIAGGAFYGNTKIISVTFPKSLTGIFSRAFCGCVSLKEILLPDGISILAEGVFAYCNSLETVTSRGKIISICDNAFYGCSVLSQVPSSDASHIGKNAFHGCEKLKEIKVNCSNIKEDAFRNTPYLKNLRKKSPLVMISSAVVDGKDCSGDVVIPEGIVSIQPYAFAGNDSITSIAFPDSLVRIEEGAFYGCKKINKLQLPFLMEIIMDKAFEKCISLTEVSGNVQYIGKGAFSYCVNLKNIHLKGLCSLANETFCGCSELRVCECNELQFIGDSCFSGCDSLSKFNFSNIKAIGSHAFSGCNSLKSISLDAVTNISSYAFEDCGRIEEVTLSQEVLMPDVQQMGAKKIGSYAFIGCTALKVIGIDEKKYCTNHYSIIFDKCIPDILKSIYQSAISCFEIDENLSLLRYKNKGRFVHIPEGIKRIESEVFKDAVNLKEIHIPASVEYIGARAFHGTVWLEKQNEVSPMVVVNNILIDAYMCQGDVVIPDYVKGVSGWAFANCFTLTGITFSSSKTVVEEYAFRNCIHLKKVTTADGKVYRLTGISDRNKELPLIVKQIFMDCYNCFKTDENNVLIECTGNIGNLFLANGITAIKENVFKNSNLLTYITLAEETTSIGESAFEQCKWLILVKNAFNVTRIEKLAFSGCTLLENVELSDKLDYIGKRAFEHCTSLKSITIPEGITEITEKAFYRCKNLKKIILPSTLKKIGKEAFAFCDALMEVKFPNGLELIETRAFAWCGNLHSKQLPEGVLVKSDSFHFGGCP